MLRVPGTRDADELEARAEAIDQHAGDLRSDHRFDADIDSDAGEHEGHNPGKPPPS